MDVVKQLDSMEVLLIPINDLVPYENNARTHEDWQIKKVAESIKAFGFTNPLLIDENNGIIAGHCRCDAARLIGLSEVPCIKLSHLSETQRKAYILADNQLATLAGWDEGLLKIELNELIDLEFNLEPIGFDETTIESYLNNIDTGETDFKEEWDGMPEFINEDKQGFKHLVVHFASQSGVDEFQKLVGQKITEKTKFIWFPQIEKAKLKDEYYG